MIKKRVFKTKDEVEVTFEWPVDDDIDVISLVADFNQWEVKPMSLNKRTKTFKYKVRLGKNQSYQFRYLLNDNVWENDPDADSLVENDFGSKNSLLSTY
ncbi:isoamylase early set domain-containing protein [Photobacterium alginatilyticum]|jgi:1,4-alpha-glucan branching enzyme|uniref:1,4-alpha-glucan branching protein n=1 Tax=Photobacterium alginatilyticum TaxID=1775171 RepID=A0ABW9YEN0_9GAMM|nr:isoamylase early set domain-containing protein [Photobacterium alginatilyticum]NBI51895.1 1,4-alpha-glucan branching protein [Photobacterium alginatilyticum]